MRTTEYAVFYPPSWGDGKYHAATMRPFTVNDNEPRVARCGSSAPPLINDDPLMIRVKAGTLHQDVDPLVCRRCLRLVS